MVDSDKREGVCFERGDVMAYAKQSRWFIAIDPITFNKIIIVIQRNAVYEK